MKDKDSLTAKHCSIYCVCCAVCSKNTSILAYMWECGGGGGGDMTKILYHDMTNFISR